MVRDYHTPHRRWIPANIHSKTRLLSHKVNNGDGTPWHRHVDQLRGFSLSTNSPMVPEVSHPIPEVLIPEPVVSGEPKHVRVPESAGNNIPKASDQPT